PQLALGPVEPCGDRRDRVELLAQLRFQDLPVGADFGNAAREPVEIVMAREPERVRFGGTRIAREALGRDPAQGIDQPFRLQREVTRALRAQPYRAADASQLLQP